MERPISRQTNTPLNCKSWEVASLNRKMRAVTEAGGLQWLGRWMVRAELERTQLYVRTELLGQGAARP